MSQFPNDENGDALRRMQENGDDLGKPRDIDFTLVFPDQTSAEAFARVVSEMGLNVSTEKTECAPELPWDVTVVKHMMPSHAGISELEETLQLYASKFGGRNDGWGCLGA